MDLIVFAFIIVFVMVLRVCCFYGFACIRYGSNCFKLFCRGVGAFDYVFLTFFLFLFLFFVMVSLLFVRFETFGCLLNFILVVTCLWF